MADAAATDFIKPFAEEIGKSMVTSVKRQINYFCCFTNNVQSFREQATKLEDKRVEVQREVDTAKRNAKLIVPQVDTWLTNIHGIQLQNRQIEPQIRKAQTGCFNILSRFSLSKKAKQKAEAMEKLREDGKFESIFQDAPPPATKLFPLRGVLPFLSRKQIEDKIVNALSVPEVNIVGIGGMGGVGKTTMADKIMHRMKTENLVDETVKVVVSQPIDMLKIQRNIAEYVGLDLKGVELLEVRAQKIRASLTRGKKILIILDDIWEEFKLEDLGIPRESGSNGCTTLLTSRNRELLNQMGAQVYAMETLREDEAWTLFRETTGACVDDPNLASTPREVVKECKGLPLAIVTIGKSLKDKPKQTWEDALPQLKRAEPVTLPKVLKDVYMPLKISYDLLEYEAAKSLFLLCCLFPEDYCISLEEVTSYCLGLSMFEVDNLEKTRNRVLTVVEDLKSRFLLLDCEDRNEVKMHDVVRDVAIFIASEVGITKRSSKGQHVNNCKWISTFTSSSNETFDDLMGCSFPSMDLFCIQHTSEPWKSTTLKIDDLSFLESMQRLSVLSLRRISFESPPQSIKSLKNLCTLRLVGCNMKSISLVGELLNLEILICSECKEIEELTIEIGSLKRLKLLDISECSALRRIEAGTMAELTELEELKMLKSFNEWESTKVNEKQKRNASIKEIELLHKLSCLEIEIKDTNLAEEEIHLPTRIVKYKILIGGGRHVAYKSDRVVHLKGVSREIQFGSWIHKLVSTTEALYLDGDGSINIDLSQAYKTIQRLEIRNCLKMKALFSAVENGNSNDIIIKFGKLVELHLQQLPSLTSLVRGAEGIEFPLLEVLSIQDCTNFKTMVSYKESGQSHNYDNDSLHFFCNPKVKCDKLKKLIIVGYENENIILCQEISLCFFKTLEEVSIQHCSNIKMLFSSSMVENLVSLKELRIEDCEEIEEIIVGNEKEKINEICVEKIGNSISHVVFPKLEELYLHNLSSLSALGKHIQSIEFPVLHELHISNCPNLRRSINDSSMGDCEEDESLSLFCQKVTFNGLKDLYIEGCDNVRKIWCQPTPIHIFTTLIMLVIVKCHKMSSLFSCCVVENLVNLNWLRIEDCNKMEQLVIGMEVNKTHPITFPKLETLFVWRLPNLTSLGKGIEIMEFPILTNLRIEYCPNLRTFVSPHQNANNESLPPLFDEKVKFCRLNFLRINGCDSFGSLFSSSTVENHVKFNEFENLVNLCSLCIRNCKKMEQLVTAKEVNKTHLIKFPKLKTLDVLDLPNLTTLGKGIEIMEFSMLTSLTFRNCSNLKTIVSHQQNWEDREQIDNANNESLSSLFDEKVKFCQLEDIEISGCNIVGSLFPSSMVESLESLKYVYIDNCNCIEKVIAGEVVVHENFVLFPRLIQLYLNGLPLLKMLCEWRCALELPSLEDISVNVCPLMEFLTPGFVRAPKLKKVYIDSKIFSNGDLYGMEDLNNFLHQQSMSTREASTSTVMDCKEISKEKISTDRD